MAIRLIFIFLIAVVHAEAKSDFLASAGLRLNDKLSFHQTRPSENQSVNYESDGLELEVRILPLHDAQAAKHVSNIELLNMKNLFQPQITPYRGEITRLVQCQNSYGPENFSFKTPVGEAKALLGGANSRREFGACARNEIKYWSVYFNFSTPGGDLISGRLFAKVDRPSVAQVKRTATKLKSTLKNLFLPSAEK